MSRGEDPDQKAPPSPSPLKPWDLGSVPGSGPNLADLPPADQLSGEPPWKLGSIVSRDEPDAFVSDSLGPTAAMWEWSHEDLEAPATQPDNGNRRPLFHFPLFIIRHWRIILPLGIALILVVWWLASTGPGWDPATLRVGAVGGIDTLNPLLAATSSEEAAIGCLYRGLIDLDWNWKPVPVLARRIPAPPKDLRRVGRGFTGRFILHRRVNWSDGVALSAQDFHFAYVLSRHPLLKAGQPISCQVLEEVSVPSPGEVILHWSNRDPALGAGLLPLPRHLMEKALRADPDTVRALKLADRPLSCGPYVVDHRDRQGIWFESNRSYSRNHPRLSRVHIHAFRDRPALLQAWKKGKLDLVVGLTAREGLEAEQAGRGRVSYIPSGDLMALAVNMQDPILRQLAVRRALFLALDRNELLLDLAARRIDPAAGFLPPRHPDALPLKPLTSNDAEAAIRQLQQGGWSRGKDGSWTRNGRELSLDLIVPRGDPDAEEVAAHCTRAWSKIGIKAGWKAATPDQVMELIRTRRFGILLRVLDMGPHRQLEDTFSSSAIPNWRNRWQGSNVGAWISREGELLATRLSRTSDAKLRGELGTRYQKLLARELPVLPLYFIPEVTAISDNLYGVRPRGIRPVTWNLETWWKQ